MWIFHCIISQDTCRIFKVQHSFGEKSATDLRRLRLQISTLFFILPGAFRTACPCVNQLYSFDLSKRLKEYFLYGKKEGQV